MAELKASPRTEWLGAIVDALRRTREAVRPESQGIAPTVGRFLTDAILPEEGINEADNWSYGNLPMQMTEGSNIPQFKSNRNPMDVLDAAGMAPIGLATKLPIVGAKLLTKGGMPAAQAMLIPLLRSKYKGTPREALLEKRIERAENMSMEGKSDQEIWESAKLAPVQYPGSPPATVDPYTNKWQEELVQSPNKPNFNPDIRMNAKAKYALAREMGVDPEVFVGMELPARGKYDLGTVLPDHPALEAYPELKSLGVNIFQETPGSKTPLGEYGNETVNIYHPAAIASALRGARPGVTKVDDTLRHETTHHIQDTWGLPEGGAPERMGFHPTEAGAIWNNIEQLPSHLAAYRERMLQNKGLKPHDRYLNITGEQHARDSAARELAYPQVRKQVPKFEKPDYALDAYDFTNARAAFGEKGATDPVIFARLLRSKYGVR